MAEIRRDVEDGNYMRLHNEIVEALAAMPLNGSEFRCLMAVFRKTYGWNKKEDEISYGQIAELTNLDRRAVIRAMQSLLDKNLIYRKDNGQFTEATWGFNKYFDQWGTSDNSVTSDKNDTSDNSVTKTSDNSVTRSSDKFVTHKRQERQERQAASAAAENSSPRSAHYEQFSEAYQAILGVGPPSNYVAGLIDDWAQRITPEAWDYALKECVDHGTTKPGYLKAIIKRIEAEGFAAQSESTNTLNFSIDEVMT